NLRSFSLSSLSVVFLFVALLLFLPFPPPPTSTLFPYTTLFRSGSELEVLHRHVAFDEFRLQHVEQGLHLEVVVGDEGEDGLGAVERDRRLRALEVVALSHLFGGLVHRVVDLLEVGTGGDVERG